jgi:hypothetical protein
MTDPYPNSSANTLYNHLLSLSNTISDFGESITSFQSSTAVFEPTNPTMPSFTRPGSIRRRFLRIISFGRYSSGSIDDLKPLIRTQDSSRRYSAPADVQSTNRPVYTAHQSAESSDSAQTTIIHEVAPEAAPFSISGLRDRYHGDYISDTEFDTPPSLEVAQETGYAAEVTRHSAPAPVNAEDIIQHPTRLRREKSFMQCNVCKRVLEYTQLHCPGCAARTLHHVPGSVEDSYTDSNDNNVQARKLQPRKGRQNQQHGVPIEESSWVTQGLEEGTAEESWTTTANDAIDASPERVQKSSPEFGNDEEQEEQDTLHRTDHCCCDAKVTIVHHCCCASGTHATADTSCTQRCCLRGCSVIAAVACVGPTHDNHACKAWKRGLLHRHICYKMSGAEYARAVEVAGRECIRCREEGGKVVKKKTAWWVRWGKWFCCC